MLFNISTIWVKYTIFILYKLIINIRYQVRHTDYRTQANITCKKIKEQTFISFLKNKKLKLQLKIGLILFYYIPLSYSLFMKIMELIIGLINMDIN